MKKTVLLLFFSFFCKQFVFSQLCNGSLGDPLVHITFGTTTNNSGSLRPGITNLIFNSNNCPNDGQYTITNTTSGCFNNSWHTITSDHTGDPGGKFMLINASLTPNDFYVDTVPNLCSNTTFEFAAWVSSVLRSGACNFQGVKPNLTFRIETVTGTVLVRYDSGDIPNLSFPQWAQYGTFFKTPVGVSTVVLRITNNAPGGCGNDLGIDDITFRPCGPTVATSIRNQSATNITNCANDFNPLTLDVSSTNGFASSIIQWQVSIDSGKIWKDIPGARSPSYIRQHTAAGYYQYRVVTADAANFSSIQCRIASNIISITTNDAPIFVPKTFVLGCTSADVLFETAKDSTYTYQWTGPNNFSSTVYNPSLPKVTYNDSGLYSVLVISPAGCMGIDSFNLKVFPGLTARAGADVVVCEGTGTTLTASGGIAYTWTPATTLSNARIANPFARPPDTTIYKVTVANQYGCKDTAKTTVNVLKNPGITAGPDKQIFEGQSVTLDGAITGNANNFYWSPTTAMTNSNTLNPTVSPTDSITYTLFAQPGQGCPAVADDVHVHVYKKVIVPNAFSPNGDGINDKWIIKGLETYPDAILHVYSRTGRLIFESKANNRVWDGTYNNQSVPVATYYYVIDLKINLAPISGWVVVLR